MLFPEPLVVAFRQPKSIKDTLVWAAVSSPSYKQLEVKTNQTNTKYVNKTLALRQTTGGNDEANKH